MQLHFHLQPRAPALDRNSLRVGEHQVPIVFVRHRRARRYVLRLRPDGFARVTIPRGGSAAEAWRFAERNAGWIARQIERRAAIPARPSEWRIGSEILFRGQRIRLEADADVDSASVRIGNEIVPVPDPGANLRFLVERYLWETAARELPARVLEYAALHGLSVRRITVRNQKSRWGSCSRRGTISLNWRLIQAPPFVRDYIILHELMHLRQMNHSSRFWREVRAVCPDYPAAEQWLKQHGSLLR